MSKNITADQGITIGLDLGDKHTQCCSLDELGEVEETFRVRSTGPGLSKRFGGMAPVQDRPGGGHTLALGEPTSVEAGSRGDRGQSPTGSPDLNE
jgi:hypothetical protein